MGVTLLRHTRPDVAPGTCYGVTDLAPADGFAAEADAAAAALHRPRCILTSPLTRCRVLADRLGRRFALSPTVVPDWREMDFGHWEGRPWADIPRAEIDAWAADFHDYRGHGGESVALLATRVTRALEDTPDGALVVTHAGCIKAALAVRGQGAGWDAKPAFGEALHIV